ncbi:hypothetical protein BKA70DRAFT_1535014 [Coprinopsis sp. MPI-PUGE-AT-0042]|nr:hypothetical protein BKA70DRAFT_1535014 [Coprinopsis sp. MPI-PUGE-AT-0042]
MLATLPEELIAKLMMDLDMKSLVRLRATCRALDRISRGPQIWHRLFLLNLGTTIPRPFFLSQPLHDCSAHDIESDLQRWETGWGSATRQLIFHHLELDNEDAKRHPSILQTHCLLPGGRWLIVGYEDGSVWSLDLLEHNRSSGTVTRRLLIPSPFRGTDRDGSRMQLQISVDFSSDEALGDSVSTYHLQRFNIAVIACPRPCRLTSTRVDIWRVHIPSGSNRAGVGLCLGKHLCSFVEVGIITINDCSLLGPALAYSLETRRAKCVVVVRWLEANGKCESSLERRYLPQLALDRIILIPGGHLFAVNADHAVYVYDWAKTFPASTLQPHEQQFPRVPYLWRDEEHLRNSLAISPPMVINDTIHIVVQCSESLSGYLIPVASGSKPIVKTRLMRGRYGLCHAQAYGYHKGLGFSGLECFTSSEYSWPGEPVSAEKRPISFYSHPVKRLDFLRGRLLFDQCSGCVVLTDHYASQLVFISFTS